MSHESVDHLTEDVEVAGVRAIMLARAARRPHGHVETELKERVASLEKEKVDLKARSKELSGQVVPLEASIARNKVLVEDAEACLSHNVNLNVELKRKYKDLRKAEELEEENAKKLEDSRGALLACMQEAKVAIDVAFVKGGAESSWVLPEADPATFLVWLQAKLGQFSQVLDSVADFGAYGCSRTIQFIRTQVQWQPVSGHTIIVEPI